MILCCSHCGADNPSDAGFCCKCGKPIEAGEHHGASDHAAPLDAPQDLEVKALFPMIILAIALVGCGICTLLFAGVVVMLR